MTRRAAIYGRVSGNDPGKDSRNLRGQVMLSREHCDEREYRVVHEATEDHRGASGAAEMF